MDLSRICGDIMSLALTAPDNLTVMMNTCNSRLILSVVRPGDERVLQLGGASLDLPRADEILQAVILDLNVPDQAADLPIVLEQLGAILKKYRQEAA